MANNEYIFTVAMWDMSGSVGSENLAGPVFTTIEAAYAECVEQVWEVCGSKSVHRMKPLAEVKRLFETESASDVVEIGLDFVLIRRKVL